MFLHPILAVLGVLAVSVPIIIHLLNRRRFQVIPWGAMEFLLAAYKKTRRRLELENIILLILRALAILLIGLGIARPRLAPDSPLAQLGEARRDVIIAIDASWSMAHREGASSAYERALVEARRVLDSLKSERQDRVTVLLAKQKPLRISQFTIQNAREALSRDTEPSFESMDLAASLELAAAEADAFAPEGEGGVRDAATSGSGVNLIFITDLQRSNFFPKPTDGTASGEATKPSAATPPGAATDTTPTTPLQAAAKALAGKKVTLRVVDVGASGEAADNVGITRIYVSEDFPATGLPVELRAAIRNFGSSPKANVVVNATVDGNRESPQTIESLGPGAEREVLFNLIFREPGDHAVEISMEQDRLLPDDKRSYVLSVRPPMRVLVVDGSPTGEPETSAAGMLGLALSPPAEATSITPFVVVGEEPVDRARFSTQSELLDQADALVLANVEGVSEEQARRIYDYADAGGAVLFILGSNVDPNSYNLRLRAGDNPKNWILPGSLTRIGEVPSREQPPFRIATLEEPVAAHLRFFEAPERRVFLTEMPVYKFYGLDVTPDDVQSGARVLARYNDPELSPFLVTKSIGRGHVGVITTALDLNPDNRWSRIAELPKTFLPLVFDLLHALNDGSGRDHNTLIGRPLRTDVQGFPRSIMVSDPSSRSERLTADEKKKLGNDRYPIEYTKTDRPGLYQMEIETAGGIGSVKSQTVKFAVGVDPEEGNLARVSAAAVGSTLPGLDVRIGGSIDPEAPVRTNPSAAGELWPWLIGAALGVLILESILATLFGRRRS